MEIPFRSMQSTSSVFCFSKEKKQELFDIGYKKTNEYFSSFFPEKRKLLLGKYKKLVSQIINFQKEVNKSNTINSYLKLCEIFMFLCEEKRYLDTNIYQSILTFKNKFINNYKHFNIFGIQKAAILNKEEISKDLLEIIKDITTKVQELDY